MSEIAFGILEAEGMRYTRTLKHSDIAACPAMILVPEHYREDGSCRHDDPDHTEMAEYGYSWDEAERRWV